ncbi:MAG: ribosome maturation factor RimM [Gammaproteobacteria bacterium]|nr:ribosome maturation factor RimM [Gammaproteobacteria bacterium]
MVTVGQVGGAYGVQGWVRIVSFTDPPSNLLDYQPWHLREQGADGRESRWQPRPAEAIRPHRGGFVARFREVADRDAAARLSGVEIAVPKACLPAPGEGEFYWRDLIGLRVVDQNGVELGVVEQLMPTGVHDVLVVQGRGQGGAEVLIPFVNAHVGAVRVRDGVIEVHWQAPQ